MIVDSVYPKLETDEETKRARALINGYPEVIANPHQGLESFHGVADRWSFNWTKVPLKRERQISKTTYATMQRFFELVVNGLEKLKGRLVVELLVNDLITGLPRLFASGRPSSYPTKFSRMWLSNVPDYTGGALNNAVFLMPYLIHSPSAMIMWNCLLNTTVWGKSTIADADYNSTLLRGEKLPQFLGCKHLHPNELEWADSALVPTGPPSLSQRPSKAAIHLWLSDVLLQIVKPSRTPETPCRVDQPNNLAAFVHLLIYLHQHIGVPAHWMTEYLSMIINNKLDTTAIYHRGLLPITVAHEKRRLVIPRRVNLLPWLEDLRLAISNLDALIPFPLPIDTPDDYILRENDLVTLEASVGPHRYLFDYDIAGSPFIATLGMAFYKLLPRQRSNPDYAIESIVQHDGIVNLLESVASSTASEFGQIHISMTALSSEILQKNRISWRTSRVLYRKMVDQGWKMWRMSRESHSKMNEERWRMAPFRTQNGLTSALIHILRSSCY
ncbi:hypothetical protein BKA70DRAFT_1181424 [Coprinopsis sp. MPI-PUGE-AT-0042]|nr:hypothetical protein BKA70DRAFT_1181424 [Coprinopsis sp. MPI-PUGE-AT-0042]